MEYKVLVNISVPEIEKNYEMYIPINKTISQESVLINRLINNISYETFPIKNSILIYNKTTSQLYPPELIIRNSDIRNGTQLVIQIN